MNDVSMLKDATYVRRRHAAVRTTDFVFNQLIPYIGNKRKLLDLIMCPALIWTQGKAATVED